jgi:hypothetical protein
VKPSFVIVALLAFALLPEAFASAQSQTPPYQPGTSHQQPGPASADAGHPLLHRPYPWGEISVPYPLINASFKHAMQRHSVRVTLDGRNVTEIAQVGAMGFEFTPAFPLSVGTHTVRVTGVLQTGQSISDGWSFTVTP